MDRAEVERELYRYPAYKATITELQRRYSAPSIPKLGQAIQAGDTSDPVYSAWAKLDADPEYRRAALVTMAIENVMQYILTPTQRHVVEEAYFKGHHRSQEGIALKCNMSRKHCWFVRQTTIDEFAAIIRLALSQPKTGNKQVANRG